MAYPVKQNAYITIYEADTEQDGFANNGLAILCPTKCEVTEELNGSYSLTMEHPIDENGIWRSIKTFRILKVQGQLFTIIKAETQFTGKSGKISVYAEHVYYKQNDAWIFPNTNIYGTDLNEVLGALRDNSFPNENYYLPGLEDDDDHYFPEFTFSSDIPLYGGYLVEETNGQTRTHYINYMIERYGGELYRNNYYYSIKERMEGSLENAFDIRVGFNLLGIKRNIDVSTFCTYFMGYMNKNEYYSVGYSGLPGIKNNIVRSKFFSYDIGTPEQQLAWLEQDVKRYFSENMMPKIEFTVSMKDVKNNPDYQEYSGLRYKVGDKGRIFDERLGGNIQVEISKTKINGITGEVVEVTFKNLNYFIEENNNVPIPQFPEIPPVHYLPLDFIRTTNRQYFNTGYVPNDNTRIECEVMLLDNYDQYGQTIFGTNMLYLTYNRYGNHGIQFAWGGNSTTVSKSLPYYRKIKIILDKELLSWYDGETLIDSVSAPTGTTAYGGRPIWIGCYNNSGSVSNFGEFCLYSFKIYENNSLIMNFVPVKRISDGVSGMLETLTNTFYPDVNGNGFLSSVFEDNFETVNSVQTSGNLYVNTQIVHTVNTKIVIDSIPNTSSQYGSPMVLYGSRYNYESGSDLWVLFVRNQQNWGGAHCMRGNDDTTYLDEIDFCSRCTISAEGLNMRFSYSDGTVIDKVLTNGALTDGINTMFLFDMNVSAGGASGSTGKSYTKFYSCQIYDNNVLIRDFIPVKRLSDNALMLYDNVLKIPFLPKGGNFTEVT